MIDNLLSAISYLEIKEKISTTLGDLKRQGNGKDILIKFIDTSISQLNGISWLHEDVNIKLKIRYSKSQLEMIKRHINGQDNHV